MGEEAPDGTEIFCESNGSLLFYSRFLRDCLKTPIQLFPFGKSLIVMPAQAGIQPKNLASAILQRRKAA
jgi:hypothetical protein